MDFERQGFDLVRPVLARSSHRLPPNVFDQAFHQLSLSNNFDCHETTARFAYQGSRHVLVFAPVPVFVPAIVFVPVLGSTQNSC